MGEMADDAWEHAFLEEQELLKESEAERINSFWLNTKNRKGGYKMSNFRYTEEILNVPRWVTGNGEILPVEQMDEEHLKNTLHYIFKNRDRYWLNCRDAKIIEHFDNGDDFFKRVIRKSTLWLAIIQALTQPRVSGFNFEIDFEEGK